jgi:hypothetical protein
MKLWFRGEGLWEVIQGHQELDSSRKDARAQLDILEYLGETDQLLIRQFETSHAQWDALKQKYEHHEPRPDSLIQQFYAFQKPKDQTIHDAYAYLQNLGYKISQSDPSLATLLDEKRLIQRLLSSLPAEYDTLVDIIDPKTDLPPDILIRLAAKEQRLAANMTTADNPYKLDTSGIPKGEPPAAHYAKRSIKGKNKDDRDLRCYLCREEHHLQDCPTRKTLVKMARAWEINQKKGKRSTRSNKEGEDDDDAAIAYSSSDLTDNEAW